MKKLLVSLAIASSALVAAAPASAQYYDRGDRGYGYQRDDYRDDRRFTQGYVRPRLDRISQQISRGQQRGVLTPREAQQLRWEHRELWNLANRFYATGGYDGRERQQLENRIARLEGRLRFERRDDDRRWDRDGDRWDRRDDDRPWR